MSIHSLLFSKAIQTPYGTYSIQNCRLLLSLDQRISMARGTSIKNLCRARLLRHQEETRNKLRDQSEAIEKAAKPLSDDDAQRPFMIPLGHEPYDIWHHIIDNIIDPQEILKTWEICPFFREFRSLKQKYIQTRLPQVVQLILQKRPQFLREDDQEDDDDEEEVSPSNRTLLKLRMLSSFSKHSTEDILLQPSPTGANAKKLYRFLRNAEDVQGIIDDIIGNEIMVDSFFPPNVMLFGPSSGWNNNPQADEALFESVGIFLELAGKRLKTFSYSVIDKPAQSVYAKLREWLMYMPSLECLELDAFLRNARGAVLPNFEELPIFPHCPKLSSFIQNWNVLPQAYRQHILKANPQIKMLSFPKHGHVKDFPDPDEINLSSQHLECLRIPLYDSIFNYREFQLPLKKMIINGGLFGHRKVSSAKFLKFLNPFKNTLEHLELEISVEEKGNYFLDLPNLKFFKMRYNGTFKDFRFLLHADNLEEIIMAIKKHKPVPNCKGFFNGILKKVTKGFDGLDLWQVFPQLKRFRMEFCMWWGEDQEILRE